MIFGSQAPCGIRAHGTDSSIFGLLRRNHAAPEASSFFLNTLKGIGRGCVGAVRRLVHTGSSVFLPCLIDLFSRLADDAARELKRQASSRSSLRFFGLRTELLLPLQPPRVAV